MRSFLHGLRFRNLVILGLALLVINVLIPDPLPFIDEILIAVVTLILSRFKRQRSPRAVAQIPNEADGARNHGERPTDASTALPRKR